MAWQSCPSSMLCAVPRPKVVPNVLCRQPANPIGGVFMLAVLQFDGVSLPHIHEFLSQGRLPALAQLRERGHWLSLETFGAAWEAASHYSLYSGKGISE